ncbi:nucleoside hydrolase [Fusarium albosuccineum]|uniref:Nucleoside hydrolase n=1 Tax=Fusarium albosuccineum TaxID=1237068 RepID=A0A8H4KVB3_9HYPO|nr:nucleoside hydrolase [Fusarium albosuccineum]
MQFRTVFVFSLLQSAGLAAPLEERAPKGSSKPKIILDNDWKTAGFIPFLQALHAGWDVLGRIGTTGDTWAHANSLHAVSTLEIGNLSSCIPVYKGSDYPLLNTPELFQLWQQLHGQLAWQGAFAPENKTYETEGNDPTSGDPLRVSKSAFIEGFPNISYVKDVSAAEFLVQTVRKHPGEVTILAAGPLTNIALAHRLDSNFAKNAKKLVIMGGYIDVNLLQVTGDDILADLQNDINLKMDPEGSKIALTAPFPNITIVGNAANQEFPTEKELNEMYKVKNSYSTIVHDHYGTMFPYWDETATAVALYPEIITNSTEMYIDVDTSYASSTYGNIHAYQEAYVPKAQGLRKIKMVFSVDGARVKRQIKDAVQHPPSCVDLES